MRAPHGGLVRWLKFNLVGVIGICVQILTLFMLKTVLGLNYLLATALAVEAAVLHNFVWHERFTWYDRKAKDRFTQLLKFNLTTGAFSIVGNMAFTKLLVRAGADYLLANALSIMLCSVINFLLNDRMVFAVAPGRTLGVTSPSE